MFVNKGFDKAAWTKISPMTKRMGWFHPGQRTLMRDDPRSG